MAFDKKKKTKRIFVVEIEICEDAWFILKNKQPLYTKGQRIMVPVLSSTAYHAEMKFSNEYWGSEFPSYTTIKVHTCDKELFTPDRLS